MALQLIFCLETDRKANTDKIYVMETLRRFYGEFSRDVKISYVPMGGKTNYKERSVTSRIRELTKQFRSIGSSHVIYCIDTDHFEKDESQRQETERIEQYCMVNGFDLVWFCHDVEEVYIGHAVAKSVKKKTAEQFKKSNSIQNVDRSSLKAVQRTSGKSNVLTVTEKYLRRTERL